MRKVINKIACICIAMFLMVGSMALLTGCGETNESRVMNVDVNPKLEFVLDKNNKVVSVAALNDDGSCILQDDVSFIGLSAEEATKKFLDEAKEYGFIIEADTNALTISMSGEGVDKLLNNVKSAAESHIQTLGLGLSVVKEKLNKEAMEEIVAKCYGELTTAQIDAMTNEELVELIKKSREETKDLLTQDLKDMYYVERAEGVIEAKIAEIKSQVNAGTDLIKKGLIAGLELAYQTLDGVYNQVQGFYTAAMQTLNSNMETYVELKKQYIEARKAENTELANTLKTSLEAVEQNLETARAAIDSSVANVKTALDNAKNIVIDKINDLIEGLNTAQIEAKINNAKNQVVADIKLAYNEINKNLWANN